ncbi:MAG: GNAT family N-acyltransferase [Pseudomonadota bacterium]
MIFTLGRFKARLAASDDDVIACQQLRYLAFIEARGVGGAPDPDADRRDEDEFDADCSHLMVEDTRSGQLVCCFRMMPLENGLEIGRTYSAKYYGLDALRDYPGKMVEMGRFCVHPAWQDPAILRVAWSAMTKFVDDTGVELMFGCSSFQGIDAEKYMDAFALLKERHLAPSRWLPRVKAPRVFQFGRLLGLRRPDMKLALKGMPPLLRTYLVMGGWVSDHAVIDNDLNTLHVFTGIETARVPQSRKRLLRRD